VNNEEIREEIRLPAERWEAMAATCAAHIAGEQKGRNPISVKAKEYRGFLYAVFAVMYGSYGDTRKPVIDAYRLVPPAMHTGDTTTVYRDVRKINADQSDNTGLIVKVGNDLLVCSKRVKFILDLPGTCLPITEAKRYDNGCRSKGWRSFFKGKEPEWFSLRGHPVAVYRGHRTLGSDSAVLFWQANGAIKELAIASDVPLEPLTDDHDQRVAPAGCGQIALF